MKTPNPHVLVTQTPDSATLLKALLDGALRASSAERELVWATNHDASRADRVRMERDRAVRSCEHLLAYAAGHCVISPAGARELGGHVYDALAAERRAVEGRRFEDEPEGHWQAVDLVTRRLMRTWRWERVKAFIPFARVA